MNRNKVISIRVNSDLYEKAKKILDERSKKYIFIDGTFYYEGRLEFLGRSYYGKLTVGDLLEAALITFCSNK